MRTSKKTNAYVLGVGLTPFTRPRGRRMYPEMGYEAGVKAMLDAQIDYDDVETGVACFCFGDTTSGQRIFYQFGMSGIPIYNTNNACATGSTGLHLARTLVNNGAIDCALVIGFEQMEPGYIKDKWADRPPPTDLSRKLTEQLRGTTSAPQTAQWFANAGLEYMEKYGATADDMAEIARVSHEHSSRNPYSQFRAVYTKEEILKSPIIQAPLTKLQCSPTSDGAGAAVIVSEDFLNQRPHLRPQAIFMAGQALMTDTTNLYEKRSDIELVGYDITAKATQAVLEEARVSIDDVKVVELHDCFSTNEMLTLDGMGFSEKGKAHEMVRRGDITYGGNGVVVNPSGGLISKGHPIGATGLAQCAELIWHLRGWATNRAVNDTKVVLQHNLGLGGAIVVTCYKRADGRASPRLKDQDVIANSAFEYNPAVEARGVSVEDAEKVTSKKYRSEWAIGDVRQTLGVKI